jgi:hypothetical protein
LEVEPDHRRCPSDEAGNVYQRSEDDSVAPESAVECPVDVATRR